MVRGEKEKERRISLSSLSDECGKNDGMKCLVEIVRCYFRVKDYEGVKGRNNEKKNLIQRRNYLLTS